MGTVSQIKTFGKAALLIVVMLLLIGGAYWIGTKQAKTPDPEVRYVTLPNFSTKKSGSEISPVSISVPGVILYAQDVKETAAISKPEPQDTVQQPQRDTISLMAETVEDWNLERIYEETLIDSDTLGRATLTAIVQYNRLRSYDFNYTSIQRTEISVIPKKTRWGIGIQAGYGYNFDKFYPYVGIGLQYSIITW